MFTTQVSAAIDAARTLTKLDHLSREIWQAFGAGAVSDDDAGQLAELLHARRGAIRGDIKPVGIPAGRPSIFPPRRLQQPPDRPVAIERRRHLAASGPMPPALAARFTVTELAALRIVSDEVRERGQCARTIAEIAARAGCCRTSVQNAIREAAGLGLVTVEERRREGQVNLPNVIRVVSREWVAWIAKRPRTIRKPDLYQRRAHERRRPPEGQGHDRHARPGRGGEGDGVGHSGAQTEHSPDEQHLTIPDRHQQHGIGSRSR